MSGGERSRGWWPSERCWDLQCRCCISCGSPSRTVAARLFGRIPARQRSGREVTGVDGFRTARQLAWARCGWLILATVGLCLVLVVPAWFIAGGEGVIGLSAAAVLCVIPGLVVFWIAASFGAAGTEVPLVILGSTALRMVFVLLGMMIVQTLDPHLGFREFVVWFWLLSRPAGCRDLPGLASFRVARRPATSRRNLTDKGFHFHGGPRRRRHLSPRQRLSAISICRLKRIFGCPTSISSGTTFI